MSSRRTPLFFAFYLPLALVIFMPAGISWGSELSDRGDLAMGLAREGRCESALVELRSLESQLSGDAEVTRFIGECEMRLERFDLAAPALESARRLDPSTPQVDLHLAMAYFHMGDVDAAEEALERAQAVDADRPEFLLYSGLLALSRADYERAIGRLEVATRLEGGPVEPMASFYLGRALEQTDELDRAESAFRRVVEESPDSIWADEAGRAIGEMREDSGGIKPWASLEVGFEYDGNALLRGRGVLRPVDVSNESDVRGFWFLDVGALLLQVDEWSGGAALRYGGTKNHDLDIFDTHAVGGTLWIDWALGVADATLRVQADFDAAWVDGDPFVVSNRWSALLYKPWESGSYTTATLAVGLDDYRYKRTTDVAACPAPILCGPVGVDEFSAADRDGAGFTAAMLHREFLPIDSDWLIRPWIEGGYLYGLYKAKGTEYDHERHQVEIKLGAELPFSFQISIAGRYAYVPYRNATIFPDPSDVENSSSTVSYFLNNSRRREQEAAIRIRLERAFGEHVVVSTRWTRTRNHSTADVFDYTRDVFGISVRVGLGG